MKLKYILIISFIFVSAVPVYVSLEFFNQYVAEISRERLIERLSGISQIAKTRIQSAVARMRDNHQLIASRTQMRLSLQQWNMKQNSQYQEKIKRIIHDAASASETIDTIVISDLGGNTVAQVNSEFTGTSYVGNTEGDIHYQTDYADGELILTLTSALYFENEKIGTIQTVFTPSFILDLVKDRTGLGKSGEWLFAITNESGDALFAVPLKYDAEAAFRRSVHKSRTDVPIIPALQGQEIILEYAPDYREIPVLAATRYIPELDWGLVAKIDEAEVNAISQNSHQFLIILEVVSLALSLLVGLLLANFISRPIERLTGYSRQLAEDKYQESHINAGFLEADTLFKAFNQMASELSELNNNLNQMVAERTDELNVANQQLQQQSNELLRINTYLEQFAYITSHDLQEPLRTIQNFTALLEEEYSDKLDEDGQTSLHFLRESAQHMSKLVNGLLEYSRIGRSAEAEQVSLDEIIKEIVQDLSLIISESKADIAWQDLPNIMAYKVEIRALLQNLITNAIKFRRPGHPPRIRIGHKRVNDEQQFFVQDNGIGIEAKYQDKIFQMFQRLHSQSEYIGEGIGLALCKKIVDLHQGNIWYENNPDQGVTFFFTLLLDEKTS